MPEYEVDENDTEFITYGIDLPGFFVRLYESLGGGDWDSLSLMFERIWNVYSIIALMFSLLFFAGFTYARIRYAQLSELEQETLRNAEKKWAARHAKPDSDNSRWDAIQKRITENTPESWRVAIIEADILLDETLTNAGYVGTTIGEKLKTANTTSFTTIQDAWEAHKVRNEIAHAGSDFVLTPRVAQETLVRFERVFREFGVV